MDCANFKKHCWKKKRINVLQFIFQIFTLFNPTATTTAKCKLIASEKNKNRGGEGAQCTFSPVVIYKPFKRQAHKMVKRIQAISQLLLTNCLSLTILWGWRWKDQVMKQSTFSTNFRTAEPFNLDSVIDFCKPKKGLSSPVLLSRF